MTTVMINDELVIPHQTDDYLTKSCCHKTKQSEAGGGTT